jgi:hypothetical protein
MQRTARVRKAALLRFLYSRIDCLPLQCHPCQIDVQNKEFVLAPINWGTAINGCIWSRF